MGKHRDKESSKETCSYLSPIAKPLFDGKLLERSIKLVKKTVDEEKALRTKSREMKRKAPRLVRRGVAEVTKALRKGEKGIVFFASDIYPVDIIAHLPVLCEESDVVYGYLGDKQALGAACRSTRPASVIMVVLNSQKECCSEQVLELYEKTVTSARRTNPYFD